MTPGVKYGVPARRSEYLRLAMHPQAANHGSYREWLESSARPLAIDLFSGAGGLSLGLEAAGFRVALAADVDEWALETHAHNFEGLALRLDLAAKEVRDNIVKLFEGVDVGLIAGGPPCQPYSRAGKSKIRSLVEQGDRHETDHRRELWRSLLDLIEEIRPRAVLMENVPDMALNDDMAVVRQMMSRLEECGYEVDARIVDAWTYEVPQHRQRLVLVGIRDAGEFIWPEPSELVTVRDAIGDLPVLRAKRDEIGAVALPYGGAKTDFQRRARKDCVGENADIVHDHVTRAVRDDDLEAFRLMKPGTLYSDLPAKLRRYRADIFDDKYNRLDWNDLSRTITAHIAKDGYWYIHPQQHRTLTVREAARIQTFPDHFRFAGSRSHQFAQIGNAVPPALAEVVGTGILDALRRRPTLSNRTSQWRIRFRDLMTHWAMVDRSTTPWAYPGDPWAVTVGQILGGKGKVGWPDPEDALALIPTWRDATEPMLATLEVMADQGRRRVAVGRLRSIADAVHNDPDGWAGTQWLGQIRMDPAARQWLDLLGFGGNGLRPSTSALRVTARVIGRDVDRQNRLTAGRMELAKLVGHGPESATVNAAMHQLGTRICTNEDPNCPKCPVRAICRDRRVID